MDSDAFGRELAACSIILLPYNLADYRQATSGVFVMAVVSRAVVVVTEDTWMARQAQKHELSRVVLLPADPTPNQAIEALRQAVVLAIKPDYPSRRERLWCAAQSGTKVLEILVSSVQPER